MGNPSTLYDDTNPDWIPTINLGYEHTTDHGQRYTRIQNRKETKRMKEAAMTLVSLSLSLAEGTNYTRPNSTPKLSEKITELSDSEKLKGALSQISELKVENEKLITI
ncbi:uncharacterized protein LOC121373261 isoform X2 [Gigantopelta aegis]|uniref:uncharacterized protein LOC121373261 isoform X2 n=1 Tax=Gigantopelta aegis TaxID=1735272 RepID=UPI001B88BB0E|nr:uncharacterized protein LOC121373261 isoform X2 [Gigantopelta aegis]